MRPSRATALRLAVGLLVSAVFLVLLLRQVDRGELADALRDVEPVWFLIAAPVYALTLWVRALRWRVLIRPHTDIGRGETASLLLIGMAANNVLPVRAGELVRAMLLHRRHGVDRFVALGSIAIERAMDGALLALALALTLLIGGGSGALRTLAVVMTAGFLVGGLLMVAVVRSPRRSRARLAGLLRFAPGRLRPGLLSWLDRFLGGITAVRGRRAWAAALALTVATWAGEAATYGLIGVAFDLGLEWWHYAGLASATNLAIAAPSTAGGLGPFEFFAREVAVVFGAGAAAGTAYALVLHAYILLPVVVIGLGLLWTRDIGFGALRPAAPPPAALPPDGAVDATPRAAPLERTTGGRS